MQSEVGKKHSQDISLKNRKTFILQLKTTFYLFRGEGKEILTSIEDLLQEIARHSEIFPSPLSKHFQIVRQESAKNAVMRDIGNNENRLFDGVVKNALENAWKFELARKLPHDINLLSHCNNNHILLSRSLTSIVLKTLLATSDDENLQSDQYSFLFSESLNI